ncbi:MAG: dockerin type I repeat-containing protein [Clostridia bacterium]|nr:dockerin type I repeat-containing protein [Clostridia bacterium]
MKRVLSVMLAVIMLVSLAPAALAQVLTPAENSLIYSIDIWDIDYPPVAGEKAGDHRSVSISEDAHFSADSLVWINVDENFTMDDDDVFVAGVNYAFGGLLYADPGYEFDTDWTMSLNFGDIEYDSLMTLVMPDHTQFRMWTAPVKAVEQNEELITSVSLSGIEFPPYVGESVEDYMTTPTVPTDAQYAVTAVYWYDDTHGVYLDNTAEFGSETYYSIGFELKSFSGYRFGESVAVSLNDGAITYDTAETGADPYNTTIFNVWTVPNKAEDPYIEPEPTPVSVLSVVNVPLNDVTAGNKPSDFDEPEIETYYGELDEVGWYNDTTGSWVDNDEEFKSGFSYSMCMWISAGPGNAFTDDIDITINGSADNVNWDATLVEPDEIALWTKAVPCYDASAYELIESISISDVDTTPVAGETPETHITYTLPADAHYTVAEVFWFNNDTNEQLKLTDVFEAGVRYQIVFRIVPDEGYRFAPYAVITINGGEVDPESGVREDGRYAMAGSLCEEAKVPGSDILIGDVTGDGNVNTGDAVMILKYAAGLAELDEEQAQAADTTGDGTVNTGDAVAILKFAAGIISEF